MEWKEVRLGDVCEIKGGKRLPKGVNLITQKNSHPYIRVRDLGKSKTIELNSSYEYVDEITQKQIQRYITQKGDILISIVGTIGLIAIVGGSLDGANLTENCVKLVKLDKIDTEYLYYYLKSPFGQQNISRGTVGAVQAKLPIKNIQDFSIICPELISDQHRIASILSSLDRKIELNNKINDDLEEMAQAIFKNWFVDFEPFKDGKFVDSELGMIPEGWKVISLNEILDNVSGYSYKGSELQSSNIAMATIKNFERKGGFKTEGYKEIVISKKIKETQFVNMFDVLVAHTDLTQNAEIVGNPAIVLSKGGYEKLIMSMDLTKVISKIEGVTNGLLYCILSTSRFKEHALGYVNGTTVLHMSKKAVPEYTCAFPKDINQIRDLCITLDSIYKRMAVTYEENSHLSLLRDTLLPRLMSGELEVPE